MNRIENIVKLYVVEFSYAIGNIYKQVLQH